MNLATAVEFAQKSRKLLDRGMIVNEMIVFQYTTIMARGISDNSSYIVLAAFVAALIDANLDNPRLWVNVKRIVEKNTPRMTSEDRKVYFTNLMNYVELVRSSFI